MEREGPPFSPPSRNKVPTKKKHVPPKLRRVAVAAAVSSIIQAVIWTAVSVLALTVFDGLLVVEPAVDTTEAKQYLNLLAEIYFEKDGPRPILPDADLLSPPTMNIIMTVFAAANALWFLVSSAVYAAVRLSSAAAGFFWLYCWLLSTGAVIVLDVVLGVLMARDLGTLMQDSHYSWLILMCPGGMLIFALRLGVLFILNVVFLLFVARTLAVERRELNKLAKLGQRYRTSVAEREGPIDAFFYRNGADRGNINPMFEPDEDDNWTTFKGPPDPRGKPENPPRAAHRQNHYRGPLSRDDGVDVSHLSWMAEVDKYIDGEGESQVSVRDLRRQIQRQSSLNTRDDGEFGQRSSIPRPKLQGKDSNGHNQGPQGHYMGPRGRDEGPRGPSRGLSGHPEGPLRRLDPGPRTNNQAPPRARPQGYRGRHPEHEQRHRQAESPYFIPPPDYTPPSARRGHNQQY